MARSDNEVRVTLSVLDRLIDYEPEISREAPASRSKSLHQMKQSLRRDLELLLNTRQTQELPADLKELNKSVAAYGLPDYSSANVKSPSDQNRMRRELEGLIETFEPRLSNVTVTLEPAREHERALHFRIDAQLMVDPAPEPVTFDTVLQLINGEYQVQGGN
jgi:type VI secretion system protein ImpF